MSGVLAGFFGGGQVVTISLSNQNIGDYNYGAAGAFYTLDNDGFVYAEISTSGGRYVVGQWCDPVTASGNYEARATLVSGSITSGTFGTWLALSSDRTWVVGGNAPFYGSCTFDISIRDTATQTVRATARITLTAQAYNF